MKKFKSKKHIKIKYKNIIIFIITITLLITILNYISNIKLIKITALKTLEYSNNYNKKNIKTEIKNITSQIFKIDINKPTTILKNMMLYETPNKEQQKFYMINEKQIEEEPLVYIYNTHQTEEYLGNDITLNPTVLTAAHYLKEKLENIGIKTLVEESSIPEILKENNWNYNQSYKASRINLEKIKEKYSNIKIFIDLHRDSVKKELSTVTIDNKDYAKVLFVIGKEHNNYEQNLQFTTSIDNIIKKYYPTLSKGILQKEGPGVNGIYNQDVDTKVILIEVGAQENTIDEVTNTLDIISNIIKEKINEE